MDDSRTRATPTHSDLTELIPRFVDFLKSSRIYPENNRRVVESADDVIRLVAARATSTAWIRVKIKDDRFVVDGVRIPIDKPLSAWMRDTFHAVSLAGIEFGADLERSSLLAFSGKLTRCGTNEIAYPIDPDNEVPGLRPLDLVFRGGHYGPEDDDDEELDAQQEFRNLLTDSERVQDQLCAVRRSVDALTATADGGGLIEEVDFLEEIVGLLPAEALSDPDRIEALAAEMLAGFQREIARIGGGRLDASIARDALAVAKRFFSVKIAESVEPAEDRPSGRRSDRAITDDLAELLAEFARLPSTERFALGTQPDLVEDPTLRAELTGALFWLLHNATRVGTLEKLEHAMRHNLRNPDDRQLELVKSAAGDDEDGEDAVRIQQMVMRCGLTSLLLRCGLCSPTLLAARFPEGFLEWLDTLGPEPSDQNRIRSVLTLVGPRGVLNGAKKMLSRDSAVSKERIEKMLSAGHEALPIAAVLARRPEHWIQERAVSFVERAKLPIGEAAALNCVTPPSSLPPAYLDELCLLQPGETNAGLRRRSSLVLCDFIRRFERDSCRHEDRARAVRALAVAKSSEGDSLLRQLARAGRFTLRRRPRELRQMANQILRAES